MKLLSDIDINLNKNLTITVKFNNTFTKYTCNKQRQKIYKQP